MTLEKPKIGIVFEIEGGNAGLTEQFIYENQPSTEEESIDISSSATVESNLMGTINKNTKLDGEQLKIFYAPCILVARNGFAGTMKYIEKGQFTTNDHAYVMTLKPEWKGKVDLRWFAFQYQELFYNLITSKSDNATFSKDYAEKQEITIPDITVQNKIADKLHKMDKLINQLDELKKQAVSLTQSKLTETT
jgi:restriction endonuclease S subunit